MSSSKTPSHTRYIVVWRHGGRELFLELPTPGTVHWTPYIIKATRFEFMTLAIVASLMAPLNAPPDEVTVEAIDS